MTTRQARRIVVLTGAGISIESGVRSFREDTRTGTALWAEHDVEDVATPAGFRRNPRLVREFYTQRRKEIAAASPNPAHQALAALARDHRGNVLLVTQNIDDLHERAGTPPERLVHMHGTLADVRCIDCDARIAGLTYDSPCVHCGMPVRPDVVWFGERPFEMPRIDRALASADVFIAVGTSGQVYPAAGMVQQAQQAGTWTVEVNPNPTFAGFDESIPEPAGTAVPRLVAELLS